MTFTWEMTFGDLLASLIGAAAIGLATWQLVSTRKDLIAERQADFYLGELMAISTHLGAEPSRSLRTQDLILRLRLIPQPYLPLLRELSEDDTNAVGARLRLEQGPHDHDYHEYVRTRCMGEIKAAIDAILETAPAPRTRTR